VSLSLKYLVPLNLVILTIWVVNFVGSQRSLEGAIITTERDAMEQVAVSLAAPLEKAMLQQAGIRVIGPQLEAMGKRWPGLDIMIIDDAFTVRLASDPSRVGRRWYEKSIENVFGGEQTTTWNLEDHAHEGRPTIDVSVGAADADGRVVFVVHIAKLLDRLPGFLHQQRRQNLVTAAGELAAVAVVINLMTYLLVLRPLHRIRRRIAGSGWLDEHPRLRRRDEILHLEGVVASMLERVETQTDELRSTLGERETALREVSADRDSLESHVEHVSGRLADTENRLVRAERIAAVAQLSGALAHELRNPLHIIRATAETAASRSPDVEDLAEDIKEEVDRVNRLITELLNYSRPSDIQRQPVDLAGLLEDVKRRMCRGQCELDAEDCGRCTIVVDPALPPIDGDPVLLEQAIMNLFANARDVSPEGSEIEMAARRGAPGEVVVTVADRGPGIRDDDRRHVFEPFFTRKEHGTGLGLPVVQRVADLHEGAIELDAREGGGTIARLRLPAGNPRRKP